MSVLNISRLLLLLLALLCALHNTIAEQEKQNVIIILADDMGFDDVSFRGSNRFLTPNIDALAYSGMILQNFYTAPMCTPSRAALLTGEYPISTGMQHYVIVNGEPWSLPLEEKTIAQTFQSQGYFTSLIGKWHQGMARKSFTPLERGFDMHLGFLGSHIDYYTHSNYDKRRNYTAGRDMRWNFDAKNYVGNYATDLFTDAAVQLIERHNDTDRPLFMLLSHLAPHTGNEDMPLQAPNDVLERFAYLDNVEHRFLAAMMTCLDEGVARVIDALSRKSMLNNTIILFMSDNGAPTLGDHATSGSNYPLRGQKNSPWEGALRSSAVIWSAHLKKLGSVWKQRIHMVDLLPTLAAAAGIQLLPEQQEQLDGLDLWQALKYGYENVEHELMHNIDDIFGYVAYMNGKWKFVNGTTANGAFDGWLGGERPSNDSNQIDPRAKNYTQTVQSTTVWQQLLPYRNNSSAELITALRSQATVNCGWQERDNPTLQHCKPLEAPCLFDIEQDPCEQNNLYEQMKNTSTVQEMLDRIAYWRKRAKKPNNLPQDPRCNPALNDGLWTWWLDVLDEHNACAKLNSSVWLIISISLLLLLLRRIV